jgi:general secretion pathway protein C
MNRYAIWAANVGLFGLCCFLLAGVITEVWAARLTPEPAAGIAAPAERANPRRARPDRGRIVDRNLFNSTELAATAPEPEPVVDEELEETQLPLKLLGTAASDDQTLAWAAIEDLEQRKHKVVATGGEARPGASVVRIERKRVVLRNNGKLEELTLDDEETPTRVAARRPRRPGRQPTPPRARAQNLADRVRKVAENKFAVDNDDVQETVRNPAALFSEARILPKYEDGAMVGIQLNAIKQGSLFEEVGLADGDTIVEFNGQSLGSPADSAQFLQQLIEGEGFEVMVRGQDGAERTLSFEATP